ncbi:MAG: hypothetical protein Q4P06_07825 [Actinomycetaceae bacterium]|nr:hypothetical protein [Actinomycetaceae bacterium]
MGKLRNGLFIPLVVLSLAACSSQTGYETRTALPTDNPTARPTQTPDDISLVELERQIHIDPREGGVKSYLLKENALEFASIDGEWKSFLSLEDNIPIEWTSVKEAVFIPVCNAEGGKFILYKGGKNIADGPCGPGQVISVSPPRPESLEKEVFSYQITGATKAEVALYIEKISQ